MKRASEFALVLITAPSLKTGRKLATMALAARLIACANVIPRIESHYWWQDKLESADEVLLLFKSRLTLVKQLETLILENHPYDTPEFVVLPLHIAAERYLQWLARECPFKPNRSS